MSCVLVEDLAKYLSNRHWQPAPPPLRHKPDCISTTWATLGMLEVNRRGVGGLPARAGHLPWPERVSPMTVWAELLVMEYQKPGHLGDTGSYPVWHLSCPTTLSQPNIMPLYGGAATQFPIWIFNHTDNHNQTSHQILKSLLQSFQSTISKYKLQPELFWFYSQCCAVNIVAGVLHF